MAVNASDYEGGYARAVEINNRHKVEIARINAAAQAANKPNRTPSGSHIAHLSRTRGAGGGRTYAAPGGGGSTGGSKITPTGQSGAQQFRTQGRKRPDFFAPLHNNAPPQPFGQNSDLNNFLLASGRRF